MCRIRCKKCGNRFSKGVKMGERQHAKKIFLRNNPTTLLVRKWHCCNLPNTIRKSINQSDKHVWGEGKWQKTKCPPPPPTKIQIFINKVLVIFMTIDFKTTACLEGEGQTEMTVTQAEQPWSGRLLFPAAALPLLWWLLLLLLLRVVVLLWVCRPFLTGISSYSLSLSTPLSVRSAKGKNGPFSNKNYVSNKLYQWRRFFSGNSLGEWDFFDNNNGAYFRPLFPRWWGKGWRMPVYCTNDAQATRLNSFFCPWRIISF